jgi:hypothetical protein
MLVHVKTIIFFGSDQLHSTYKHTYNIHTKKISYIGRDQATGGSFHNKIQREDDHNCVFHESQPDDFCGPPSLCRANQMIFADHHRCAPSRGICHPQPNATRRTLTQFGCTLVRMQTINVSFIRANQMFFFGSPPLHAITRHPPPSTQRYAPRSDSVLVHVRANQMIFADHHRCAPSRGIRRPQPNATRRTLTQSG